MLNNQEFINLERRLWREGNPLCDELVSTRDELLHLLSMSKKILQKYSPVINALHSPDDLRTEGSDLEFFRDWDAFGDTLDNISYDLGIEQ
jgi:hypothetical protein